MFSLGQIRISPGSAEQLPVDFIIECIRRHAAGDFGELDAHDLAVNRSAIAYGTRILSLYYYRARPEMDDTGIKVFVITEGDRSATTILLADEY